MAENTTAYFTLVDFVVFVLMLSISACTALYYALTKYRREQYARPTDYHELSEEGEEQPGDVLTPWKGGLGIFVGFVSAITYLGIPAETYLNGVLFWSITLTVVPAAIIINNGYLPIFYRLRLHNVFDYLELRFNRFVRLLGVLGNYFNLLIYMTVVMYGLACALSAVTHVKLWGAILSIGLVRTVFTTVGGVNAILWVDLFQALLMVAGFVSLIIGGCLSVGGIGPMWESVVAGKRADLFSFDLNPTTRHTTWALIVGGIFLNLTFLGPNQMTIKQYRTCLTEQKAKRSVWIGLLLCAVFQLLAVFTGIAMYAFYQDCDPYTSGQLERSAELLPHFIVDMYSDVPGMAGLLVSAIFSASMSSTSTGIYSLAQTTTDDFIKLKWDDMSPFRRMLLIKALSCTYGLLCMGGAFAISQVNSILQTVLSWAGIIGGPVLGIFTLGFFSSRSNSKGAICGFIAGLAVGLWIFIGANVYPPQYDDPPLSTTGCNGNLSYDSPYASPTVHHNDLRERFFMDISVRAVSPIPHTPVDTEYPPIASLYAMSYLYFSAATWLITILMGTFVSMITKAPRRPDSALLNPYIDICFCCRKHSCSNSDVSDESEVETSAGKWRLSQSDPDPVQMETWRVQEDVAQD